MSQPLSPSLRSSAQGDPTASLMPRQAKRTGATPSPLSLSPSAAQSNHSQRRRLLVTRQLRTTRRVFPLLLSLHLKSKLLCSPPWARCRTDPLAIWQLQRRRHGTSCNGSGGRVPPRLAGTCQTIPLKCLPIVGQSILLPVLPREWRSETRIYLEHILHRTHPSRSAKPAVCSRLRRRQKMFCVSIMALSTRPLSRPGLPPKLSNTYVRYWRGWASSSKRRANTSTAVSVRRGRRAVLLAWDSLEVVMGWLRSRWLGLQHRMG